MHYVRLHATGYCCKDAPIVAKASWHLPSTSEVMVILCILGGVAVIAFLAGLFS